MSVEENIATLRALFEAANRDKSFAALSQLGAADYKVHVPGVPTMDAAGMAQWTSAFFGATPDLDHDVVDVFGDGDSVAVRLRLHGKHTAPLVTPAGTILASNNAVDFEAINMTHFVDGKLAEQWIAFDMMMVMHQLGALPG